MAFINSICSGSILISDDYYVTISGKLNDSINQSNRQISYIAAAPPNRLTSFTGSLLPFPNALQAFDNTPIKGALAVNPINKQFSLKIPIPNSYYGNLGSDLIPPTLYLQYETRNDSIILTNSVLFRSLTYPETRKDVLFYDGLYKLPVRTQENILYASAFHTKNQSSFWGQKPAL